MSKFNTDELVAATSVSLAMRKPLDGDEASAIQGKLRAADALCEAAGFIQGETGMSITESWEYLNQRVRAYKEA
jgi:hypothetical protein